MYRLLSLLLVLTLCVGQAEAQKSKKQDVEAILGMCGCYKVTFSFAETFSPVRGYEYPPNYYSGALEYAMPIEVSKNKITIQHLLVVGDSTVIKHWRQDWIYENTELYTYHKDNTWLYKPLAKESVKGQWTQKVYQVDDSPRYESSGSWVHKDGNHYWEAYADAPLPRREYTKRSDYNVMVRRNRQQITDSGWVHEQDNDKVLRESSDEIISREKGMNTYKKVEESKCQPAIDWWANNSPYWKDVRIVWDELFAQKQTVKLNMKVDDTILFMRLFGLGDEFKGDAYNSAEAQKRIKEAINLHLAQDTRISFK